MLWKKKTETISEEHSSEIADNDSVGDKLRRMCRQNKLALISAILIAVVILLALLAPVIAPYGEAEQSLTERLAPPSAQHLLGCDYMGRDVLTRLLYGARVSLLVGIMPSIIALLFGVTLGMLAGYYGGWLDYIIMRIADVMLSIPSLLLAMVVTYTFGKSVTTLFIALSITSWASVARVVRSQTLSLKETEYVEAARSIGVSRFHIMWKHIFPNCVPSLIVLFTLNVPSAILSESSLSFLGIGVQAPASSWGLMVNEAKQFLLTNPSLSLTPCLAIMIVVLAFNFLGDGLRDVLDPYMQK